MARRPEKGNAPEVAATGASSVQTQPMTEGFDVVDSTCSSANRATPSTLQRVNPPAFNFGNHPVRVVIRDGEPWFVASDVCEALDYVNPRKAVADHLDDDERGVTTGDTLGGKQKMTIINESGLYALVLRSRKPEARKFAKWVTSEVLPAIRRSGAYVMPYKPGPGDTLSQAQQDALRAIVRTKSAQLTDKGAGKDAIAKFNVQAWSKLKNHFGVGYRQIPAQEFEEAVSLLTRHTVEWGVVDDGPRAGTVNEMVAEWVRKVEEPNGYPAMLFMPLVDVVQRKMGKRMAVDGSPAASIDPTRLAPAMAAANAIAAKVQQHVFGELLRSKGWKLGRWLLSFNLGADGETPVVREIANDEWVCSADQLARNIGDPGFILENRELAILAAACNQRLAQRLERVAAQVPARVAA